MHQTQQNSKNVNKTSKKNALTDSQKQAARAKDISKQLECSRTTKSKSKKALSVIGKMNLTNLWLVFLTHCISLLMI